MSTGRARVIFDHIGTKMPHSQARRKFGLYQVQAIYISTPKTVLIPTTWRSNTSNNPESVDLMHFCWRPRSAPSTEPELDLLMVPGDGTFIPYLGVDGDANSEWIKSPTTGRIFVLKFSSSSQRHLFWLQSKSQEPTGSPSAFSQRDQKLGQIVDMLLSGQEIDVQEELQYINQQGSGRDNDGDDAMEDVQGPNGDTQGPGSGGAGSGATGGDVREEGEEAREGGADGARA